jgi:hypothetical protein
LRLGVSDRFTSRDVGGEGDSRWEKSGTLQVGGVNHNHTAPSPTSVVDRMGGR